MKNDELESLDDEPTELTMADIDKAISYLENYEIRKYTCFKCGCEFFPNYDSEKCDECYFKQFPKEQVKAFCRSFFD